jgi:NAD(P)-dependent dehydrogenase (short-subunit alcohol dehydrogenase family)
LKNSADYILITGATGSIGSEISKMLSNEYKLILSGRNFAALNELQTSLKNSEQHLVWCVDLFDSFSDLFDLFNEFLSKKEISCIGYVHVAGVALLSPLKSLTTDRTNRTMVINFLSSLEILKVFLLKKNKITFKHLVFISALWSIRSNVGNSIYAASKGAINAFVLSAAKELAPTIRVNAILPGLIKSELLLNSDVEYIKKLEMETPLGFGTKEDVANLVLFLLSDKSRWITGQNIVLDGGRSLL